MGRFVGTGRDELGRYPEGMVVDADTEAAEGLVDRGWIKPLSPVEHPGRKPVRQLADAAVRGDLFTDPDDREAAVSAGLLEQDDLGRYTVATPKARALAGDEPEPVSKK